MQLGNARNTFKGSVFNDQSKYKDLYGNNIQVDYRGYEVNVENVIRLLTAR
jgi:phosphatidylinositol glycan class K